MGSKEDILARLKKHAVDQVERPEMTFETLTFSDPLVQFEKIMKAVGGNCVVLEDPRELNGTDVGVIRGDFGILENGMVWINQRTRYKALFFISEALVILLDRNRLVNNMHEAYKQPAFDDFGYGCFISGPSKTADIEQALVIGAHGARAVTVILE